ncbi:MAG: GAF domain-containing protein [Deltaproteobacteria bacterium]|nr:GAF domain-containing protein [Deltaproteobacteria bacterium]MBW2417236.1 GAF domain-containing protein [Deltaproteobacteria bacterium]
MTKDDRDNENERTSERGAAVLSIFQRGAEFTKQILAENERLREQLSQLDNRQQEAAQSPEQWEKLRQELSKQIVNLEGEKQSILEQLEATERENHQFAERYIEIEEENNNLANLYVASYQLHSTLEAGEVLKVILEIVINLVGAEIFAVYVWDEKAERLEPVASEGRAVAEFPSVRLGEGFVGESVASGEVDSAEIDESDAGEKPVVCIPLRVEDRPVGAIVICSLLQQKAGFSELDHELFTLLAGHAATAICASQLYSQSERKLSTIQGFIELLSK